MKVFWSWQNDAEPKVCRHFIKAALDIAVPIAGDTLGLEEASRPELDHDTKGERGMVDISATILRKITESAVFVADVTPVGEAKNGKALPNPNVMIELGWAMQSIGPNQIVPILNEALGHTIEDLPFDIRHRRTLTYSLPPNCDAAGKKRQLELLSKELSGAIAEHLQAYREAKATTVEISAVPASSDDPSVWATATNRIVHRESGGRIDRTVTVRFKHGPGFYIRIIPEHWQGEPPPAIALDSQELAVFPPSAGANSGSFGISDEGFVRYWHSKLYAENDIHETDSVSMYFDGTGEFWVRSAANFHVRDNGEKILDFHSMIRNARGILKTAIIVLDKLEAPRTRRVEVGLARMKDATMMNGQYAFGHARKDNVSASAQMSDWSDENQRAFLKQFAMKLFDTFGVRRPEDQVIEGILA